MRDGVAGGVGVLKGPAPAPLKAGMANERRLCLCQLCLRASLRLIFRETGATAWTERRDKCRRRLL